MSSATPPPEPVHKMGIHGKIAGACLALSASAVLGFLSMSPPAFTEARAALIVAAISLLVLYIAWVFSHPDMVRAQLLYGVIVAFFLVFGIVKGSAWINYRENTLPRTPLYSGILTAPQLMENGFVSDKILLQIGRARVFFNNSQTLDFILKQWSADRFTVESTDGKAYVSTRIRDDKDNIIAELYRNEWKINPPPATWDRNYTDEALEVIDPKGDVVLQIRVLPGVIQIQGEWWVTMGEIRQRLIWREVAGGAELGFCSAARTCGKITPMFKYPSDKHLGELE